MATRKPQDAIRVCIAETDPRQVLLARYLRETGRITSQLMGAADAFYYSTSGYHKVHFFILDLLAD